MDEKLAQLEPLLSDFIAKNIESRLFPGCSVAIWSKGFSKPLLRSWGRLTYVPWSPAVTDETLFDLASLTKPIVTALSVASLVAEKKIDLETRLKMIFSEARNRLVGEVTIASLLSHSSGLFPHIYFHPMLLPLPEKERKERLFKLLVEEKPTAGSQVYSDLGFMLLGLMLERILGKSLDEIARKRVFEPFILADKFLFAAPSLKINNQKIAFEKIAPTGFCPVRNRLIWAEVNDLNSWALGGITGHAGLFSTAKTVLALMQQLLELYQGKREKIGAFTNEVIRLFFTRVSSQRGDDWALGFDTPSEVGSSCGRFFTRESVGHLGFTGTSVWMDLKQEAIVIFLSNRTFPIAERIDNQPQFKQFRPKLHNLIMGYLADF